MKIIYEIFSAINSTLITFGFIKDPEDKKPTLGNRTF
jgi:hypothetical protein